MTSYWYINILLKKYVSKKSISKKISLLIFRTKSFGAVSTPPGAGILAHRHVIVAENTKSPPKNNRKHTPWDVLSAIHIKVYLIKINFSRKYGCTN